MQRDPLAYLQDIFNASAVIVDITANKTLSEYLDNVSLRSGVERQFIIIGEALNRLASSFPELAREIPECRAVINFRHVLVHHYDLVQDRAVWAIVESKLPTFQNAIVQLKVQLESRPSS